MKKISLELQSATIGGTFCQGFGAVAAVYGAGVAFNLWNPIGWGGTAALAVGGLYCAFK